VVETGGGQFRERHVAAHNEDKKNMWKRRFGNSLWPKELELETVACDDCGIMFSGQEHYDEHLFEWHGVDSEG
jgi:hypothetical protein